MKTKEAIERVRSRFNKWALDEEDLTALQTLGLVDKESEEERIRKDIIAAVEMYGDFTQSRKEEIYTYLEKQKEQKPAEWSYPYGRNETVDRLVSIAECLEMDGDCLFNGYTGTECGKFLRDLARKRAECKSTEWSGVVDETYFNFYLPEPRNKMIAYLEKQKEQKPIDIDFVSDWLRKHIKAYVNSEYNEFHKTVEYDGSINIEHLIEDLKKAIEQQSFAHKNDFVSKPAELNEENWNK